MCQQELWYSVINTTQCATSALRTIDQIFKIMMLKILNYDVNRCLLCNLYIYIYNICPLLILSVDCHHSRAMYQLLVFERRMCFPVLFSSAISFHQTARMLTEQVIISICMYSIVCNYNIDMYMHCRWKSWGRCGICSQVAQSLLFTAK